MDATANWAPPATRRNSRAGSDRPPRIRSAPCTGWRNRRAPLGGHRAMVSTPWRFSSSSALKWARRVEIGFRRGQCRPPPGHRRVRGPSLRVGHRVPAEPRGAALPVRGTADRRARDDARRPAARTGAKVSPVTQPAQISSHRADFTVPSAPSASWRKKKAPRASPGWPSTSRMARWVSVNSISAGGASVSGAVSAWWNAIQPSLPEIDPAPTR